MDSPFALSSAGQNPLHKPVSDISQICTLAISEALCTSFIFNHVVKFETMGGNSKKNKITPVKADSPSSNKKAKVDTKKSGGADKKGKSAEEKIMEVLAKFHACGETPVEKEKVSKQADVAAKTLANTLPKLKRKDHVHVDKNLLSLTEAGVEFMGDLAKVASSNDEVLERIKEELKGKQLALFEALLDGEVHCKEEVARKLGFDDAKKKGFVNLAGALSGKKIVSYPEKGKIQLNHERCFPFGKK